MDGEVNSMARLIEEDFKRISEFADDDMQCFE